MNGSYNEPETEVAMNYSGYEMNQLEVSKALYVTQDSMDVSLNSRPLGDQLPPL